MRPTFSQRIQLWRIALRRARWRSDGPDCTPTSRKTPAAVSCAATSLAPSRWSEHRFSSGAWPFPAAVPAWPGDGSAIVGSQLFGCSPSAAGCGIER
mgnify:CR=1 FL=1